MNFFETTNSGDCGCKAAPAALQRLLNASHLSNDGSDDAAVLSFSPDVALVASTDFAPPLVGNPDDWGRITATHALSDIFAMGATPLFSLSIVALPHGAAAEAAMGKAMAGLNAVAAQLGAPVLGGHTIHNEEPLLGLAVMGTVPIGNIKRKGGSVAGDLIILTKPIGVGIYASALRADALTTSEYAELIAVTTQANFIGSSLGANQNIHAMTDVTGFGLIGHAVEMARSSMRSFHISASAVPTMNAAVRLAKDAGTALAYANADDFRADVEGLTTIPDYFQNVLFDPQTSGGLLFTCEQSAVDQILRQITAVGFGAAAIIGRVHETGVPVVIVK